MIKRGGRERRVGIGDIPLKTARPKWSNSFLLFSSLCYFGDNNSRIAEIDLITARNTPGRLIW
jgi:hypothetical protein